ncbi:photosynthetic reaction center subunit H [Alterisphingorhabdus coralli]|uniref:Photosynthetic reaction center subunit H n=1 Tax=Alterisphingorhabdus coralli TaxID=3071408 RepID=A0AA97HZE3_9SPHN|nr:photosynthetic reaction center subunit H [Parasphingorhabdus sp. SCSIO 66989]WOE74539.1 photosynthetic reaction center subunit H [Parasphingorhabdus sp. SCSIO 66989]
METHFVGVYDVAFVALIAFFGFFLGLVFYLRREDRREGYPLEHELSGRSETLGGPLLHAEPKTFKMPFDRPDMTTPTIGKEATDIAARRSFRSAGAPYVPTGNPLKDGIGPASYANRSDHPDLDGEGRPRIVPIDTVPYITVHKKDADPRGMEVVGADGKVAGTVSDIWVDRAEHQVRYLEVDTGSTKVLAPMAMSTIQRRKNRVTIDAINAADFADAPTPKTLGQITFYEEERVIGYFGGGYLYANRDRQEPLI